MRTTEIGIACRSDVNVLITGPTGSGKTRLARAIHERSNRREKPFITVNLASLHEGTLESELFGHEKGAFTGAELRRVGRIDLANGGTLFLDEIGELSPRLQARLLEFLQSRTLTPVGGNRVSKLDVRVIAATHRNLARSVADGSFREDLFHRLRVISIGIPGLVERPDDFDSVLHSCLEEICETSQRIVLRLSEEVAEKLETYSWPGNIRELRNVLEYAVLSCMGSEISVADLPAWFGEHEPSAPQAAEGASRLLGTVEMPFTLDYHATFAHFESEYIKLALYRCRGRINKTARLIGMNKTTLLRRIRAYGLNLPSLEASI